MKKALCVFLFASLFVISAQADVVMTANDGIGTSSFTSAGKWSNGSAPSAANNYSTLGYLLRTPSTTGNYTFAGNSLTVGGGNGGGANPFLTDGTVNNNALMNKTPTGSGVTITVNNLILNAGSIRDGMGSADVWTLAGHVNVTANGGGIANQCRLNLDSVISGSGTLYIANNGSGEANRITYINSALNTYCGSIKLLGSSANNARLTFSDNSLMNFVIDDANSLNTNKIFGTGTVVYNGDFAFYLDKAGTTVGKSWPISNVTSQTFGDTFTVIGFTDAGNNLWTKTIGNSGSYYAFDESTGVLSVRVQPPHDPTPANQTTNVPLTTTTLNWKGTQNPDGTLDSRVVKYFVYTNEDTIDQTEPNLTYQNMVPVSGNNPDASYTLGVPLTSDHTLTWQVEQVMSYGSGMRGDPNNILGPIWSFSTPKAIPVVPADQPAGSIAFPGEAKEFTVTFTSLSTPTVRWFKNDNTTATELFDGITTSDNGGGSWTTILALTTSLSVSDEGQYYCTVKNDSGLTEYPSGIANLVIKRELARYNFAGDLTDSSGNNAPTGTALDTQGDPNSLRAIAAAVDYVTGADGAAGSALYLNPNEYVDFTWNGYPKANPVTSNGYGGGLDTGTIIYWIKPDTAKYQIVLGNFNDTTSGVGFLAALQEDGDQDLLIRNAGPYVANHVAARPNRPEYNLQDGDWHMMAACWGGNASALYVDGQWVGAFTDAIPASYTAWQRGVLLGASRQPTRHLLSDMLGGGAVDNLRIYNYRLDESGSDRFAQEYLGNTGVHPCINMSFVGNSYNFDNTGSSYCKVDLADFAKFAAAWLTNGLY